MRVAITGAGGQIGSFLAGHLAGRDAGLEVVAVCRNGVAASLLESAPSTVRIGSITDPDSARRLLGDCGAIVHCAFATGLPRHAGALNDAMLRHLFTAPQARVVVYLSSVEVYGSCIDHRMSTFDAPRPDTNYGRAKRRAERRVLALARRTGRRGIVWRLGHVYGAEQAMSRTVLTLAREECFRLPFDGARPSNAIHIDWLPDAVRIALALDASGIWNVADHPQRTWREVFDWHTGTLGLSRVEAMSDEVAETVRRRYVGAGGRTRRRWTGRLARWAASVGLRAARGLPSVREACYSVLERLPAAVERRAGAIYRTAQARAEVVRCQDDGARTSVEPWLLSDAMPGRYLDLSTAAGAWALREPDRRADLARWYTRLASPRGAWLAANADRLRPGVARCAEPGS